MSSDDGNSVRSQAGAWERGENWVMNSDDGNFVKKFANRKTISPSVYTLCYSLHLEFRLGRDRFLLARKRGRNA